MSSDSFEAFRQHVLLDPRLQELLRSQQEPAGFAAFVVQAGKAAGFDFSVRDVEEAMRVSRQVWLERWLS